MNIPPTQTFPTAPSSACLDELPDAIQKGYEIHEFRHACAILRHDFHQEFDEIIEMLSKFKLKKSWILEPGGSKSQIAKWIDCELAQHGWIEKKFDIHLQIDGRQLDSPTHKVDCLKNRIALEIEWNNKDPFFDRDLNNFRLLFDLRAISAGVIITRTDSLQEIFKSLNRGSSYGQSTTHLSKLLPRIRGGGGGGCPILVFAIKSELYDENA
jgi:hypothetical protein